VISTKDNGKTISNKERESFKYLKETSIEVFGKRIISTARDNTNLLMAIIIKATSMKVQDMEKANIFGMIKVVIKVNGNMIKCMAMEDISMYKVWLLRESFKMIHLLETTNNDYIIFIMVNYIKI
jgi:hypothetical protein